MHENYLKKKKTAISQTKKSQNAVQEECGAFECKTQNVKHVIVKPNKT